MEAIHQSLVFEIAKPGFYFKRATNWIILFDDENPKGVIDGNGPLKVDSKI